ncbi:sugar phosphate isomerase/epimerase family protein [Bifidobacterium simiarum]|uniref:sugar phosphate isomerase/epimerase family protein n=1 Tax=Bifidobacterium simiarum TaxID=2045441 RepID=UPI001BDD4148|nr:hypothetical protein [Bifidobacterium simiarum]MBT1166367.1 sugar phosphate isomerase/epimerase [Bifidobacterium simiarum]
MKHKVYAQLYSLLRTNQKDLIPALKTMSEIGYDGVELMGTYTAGMSIEEYRQLLSDLHLDPISSHGLLGEDDYDKAREIGVRYTDIRPEIDEYTRDGVLRAAEKLNQEGELRAKHGLKAVVHNHSIEFRWVLGEENQNRVYDLLIANTDPTYVNYEFDVGWGAFSGVNCVDYVRQYPGRFKMLHVKEATRVARSNDELEHFPKEVLALGNPVKPEHPQAGQTGFERGFSFFSAEQARLLYNARTWNGKLGEGIIDWQELIQACEDQGAVAYVAEREYYGYEGGQDSAAVCAKDDYEYLRSVLAKTE